jgi:hypothetical protein
MTALTPAPWKEVLMMMTRRCNTTNTLLRDDGMTLHSLHTALEDGALYGCITVTQYSEALSCCAQPNSTE